MKKILLIGLSLLLSGCVSVAKIEGGDRVVGERLTLTIEGAWNHVNAPGLGPAQVWTMEGMTIDQMLIYTGLKDGEVIHAPSPSGQKSFTFKSSMQPDEIVGLFEGTFTRDGSTFKLVKLEPANVGGQKGFRFEYALVRKVDSVRLSGVGFVAVSRNELFAVVYQAPRLVFFERNAARIENIGRSMRING